MDQNPRNNPENNFFQISLSQQGANWLLRVAKITSWLFVLGIVGSVLSIISITIRYFKLYGASGFKFSLPSVIWLVPLVFEVLITTLTLIQIFYFYKFTRRCRKGIELQQADEFNESFQSLLKNSLLAVVIFILHLCLAAWSFTGNYLFITNNLTCTAFIYLVS